MATDWAGLTDKAEAIEEQAAQLKAFAADLRHEFKTGFNREAAHVDLLAEAKTRLDEANERTEAVRIVLMALAQTVGQRAINRRAFQDAVRAAAADVPNDGPRSVRHTVFLEEVRRVLGVEE